MTRVIERGPDAYAGPHEYILPWHTPWDYMRPICQYLKQSNQSAPVDGFHEQSLRAVSLVHTILAHAFRLYDSHASATNHQMQSGKQSELI